MVTEAVQTENAANFLPQTSYFQRFIKVFFGRKIVIFGSAIIVGLLVIAIFAPFIAPYDPYQTNLVNSLQPPSKKHLLGTDQLGRDILSRIIYGSRVSLAVGIISISIASLIGLTVGLIAGFFGGKAETIIMRIIDAIMAIPALMLALTIGLALGGGLYSLIISLSISLIPTYARLMRGQVVSVKESDYIKAAEVAGSSNFRVMWLHIFPNCLSPIIVLVTLNLGTAILTEASLSFLGVGIQPPAAAWGSMVSQGHGHLIENPMLSIVPGFCIMLVVLAFNFVGDGLRDALDPRLRGII